MNKSSEFLDYYYNHIFPNITDTEKEYALKILNKENQPIHNPQNLSANKRRRTGGNDSQPISTKQIITIGDIHGDFKILMVVLFKIIKSDKINTLLLIDYDDKNNNVICSVSTNNIYNDTMYFFDNQCKYDDTIYYYEKDLSSMHYYQIRNIKLYVNQNDQINKYKEIQIDYFKDIVLILLGDIFDSMHENSDYALNKITKDDKDYYCSSFDNSLNKPVIKPLKDKNNMYNCNKNNKFDICLCQLRFVYERITFLLVKYLKDNLLNNFYCVLGNHDIRYSMRNMYQLVNPVNENLHIFCNYVYAVLNNNSFDVYVSDLNNRNDITKCTSNKILFTHNKYVDDNMLSNINNCIINNNCDDKDIIEFLNNYSDCILGINCDYMYNSRSSIDTIHVHGHNSYSTLGNCKRHQRNIDMNYSCESNKCYIVNNYTDTCNKSNNYSFDTRMSRFKALDTMTHNITYGKITPNKDLFNIGVYSTDVNISCNKTLHDIINNMKNEHINNELKMNILNNKINKLEQLDIIKNYKKLQDIKSKLMKNATGGNSILSNIDPFEFTNFKRSFIKYKHNQISINELIKAFKQLYPSFDINKYIKKSFIPHISYTKDKYGIHDVYKFDQLNKQEVYKLLDNLFMTIISEPYSNLFNTYYEQFLN